jgi:hypothetical protein
MKIARISIFVGVISILGCSSGNLFLNKGYHFENTRIHKLAILPVARPEYSIDTLMTEAFLGLPIKPENMISPSDIRTRLDSDEYLAHLLSTVLITEHTKKQLKSNPSLLDFMTRQDLYAIQERLDMADLMIIPTRLVAINANSRDGSTFGVIHMRLYDLGTGALIFQNEKGFFDELEGKDGIDFVTWKLTQIMADCYYNYYYNPTPKNSAEPR